MEQLSSIILHSAIQEVPVDPVDGIGSGLSPVDLSGIEEAAIVDHFCIELP